MADLEAKREARRQRILAASEQRMKFVLGQTDPGESKQEQPGNGDGLSQSEQSLENKQNYSNEQTTLLRQRRSINGTDSATTVESRPVSNTVKISPLKKANTHISNPIVNESLNASRSSSDTKIMLKHFEFLRIVLCFMTAFVCRKLLSSGYGVFYFQTIILPFVCLEAGFFMFKQKILHNVMLPHKSSMLIGMLMLCGIRPAILNTYNKLMGYFTAAGEDFALFFFAFMMSHLLVT